jgi:hypothetical protein
MVPFLQASCDVACCFGTMWPEFSRHGSVSAGIMRRCLLFRNHVARIQPPWFRFCRHHATLPAVSEPCGPNSAAMVPFLQASCDVACSFGTLAVRWPTLARQPSISSQLYKRRNPSKVDFYPRAVPTTLEYNCIGTKPSVLEAICPSTRSYSLPARERA